MVEDYWGIRAVSIKTSTLSWKADEDREFLTWYLKEYTILWERQLSDHTPPLVLTREVWTVLLQPFIRLQRVNFFTSNLIYKSKITMRLKRADSIKIKYTCLFLTNLSWGCGYNNDLVQIKTVSNQILFLRFLLFYGINGLGMMVVVAKGTINQGNSETLTMTKKRLRS